MSDPKPGSPDSSRHGNGAKYMLLLLVGLLVGVVATVMAMRALDARRDHFPGSVMQVQQWHLAQLRSSVERNRCSAADSVPHLQTLRATGNDLEPAFPGLADDERFATHASQFRRTLDAALSRPPADCEALGVVVQDLGESCKGCHQDFRG